VFESDLLPLMEDGKEGGSVFEAFDIADKARTHYCVKHPFLHYAAKTWPIHLSESQSSDDPATLRAALGICASHSNRLRTWFNVYDDHHDDLSAPWPKDITCLWVATHLGLEGLVKYCLEQGAEINPKDTIWGDTPLVLAVQEGHEAIVEILLENGAEVNAQDDIGWTALMVAPEWESDEAIVELLLRHHADPNIQDKWGWTALIVVTHNNSETIVKLLLESNADPNIQDKMGLTALILAVKRNQDAVVKILLEHGANPNVQNGDGTLH